jgi:hypothetical protein
MSFTLSWISLVKIFPSHLIKEVIGFHLTGVIWMKTEHIRKTWAKL